MNVTSWWNAHRTRYALPAACVTSAVVWVVAGVFQKPPSRAPQSRAASIVPASKAQAAETVPDEPLRWERTPENIAEILRTDPRGTQREDRAPVWTYVRAGGGLPAENETAWLLGADEALSWLRGAEQAAAEIEEGLTAIVLDGALPPSLREYALQHLGLWSEEHTAGMGVLSAFKQVVLTEQASALAGIALTTVCRSGFGAREADWIQTQAMHLASSRQAHPVARAAALEILAQFGECEAEPIARSLFSKGATIHEKISALEVLGKVGTAETLSWLTAVSEEAEPLTASARRRALEVLRGRLRAAE